MQETQETRVWSLGGEGPLEEGMATRSCILAWKIPWTEEPGRLQSMESQKVEQNWVAEQTQSLLSKGITYTRSFPNWQGIWWGEISTTQGLIAYSAPCQICELWRRFSFRIRNQARSLSICVAEVLLTVKKGRGSFWLYIRRVPPSLVLSRPYLLLLDPLPQHTS